MRYKLIKDIDPALSPIQQVLSNRGIKLSEIHHYLNTTDADICSAEMFGQDLIRRGAITLIETIKKEKNMLVLVDCDCDGYTSAAIL